MATSSLSLTRYVPLAPSTFEGYHKVFGQYLPSSLEEEELIRRKCLLLLNPLHPLTHLLSPTPASAPTIIRHLIDLSSALSDDVFTLSRLGIVSRRKGRLADRWAKSV
jgi:hypothetical protein